MVASWSLLSPHTMHTSPPTHNSSLTIPPLVVIFEINVLFLSGIIELIYSTLPTPSPPLHTHTHTQYFSKFLFCSHSEALPFFLLLIDLSKASSLAKFAFKSRTKVIEILHNLVFECLFFLYRMRCVRI